MKIKSNPNKRQGGDSFGGFIFFLIFVGVFFIFGIIIGSTDESKGSKIYLLKQDAVAHGYGKYTLNLDTLKPEFHWNTETNFHNNY